MKAIHFIRIDLGERPQPGYLLWVQYLSNRHEWECEYEPCVSRKEPS